VCAHTSHAHLIRAPIDGRVGEILGVLTVTESVVQDLAGFAACQTSMASRTVTVSPISSFSAFRTPAFTGTM
jgi:hypothetical protein